MSSSTVTSNPSSAAEKPRVPSPKPLWKMVVNVIMTNFALLVILLLLLVQLIRTHEGRSGFDSILIPHSHYQTQIAEVVAFTKMMRFQVEVMDRKIANLDGRVKTMEKSDWLSKDEFNKFLEELRGCVGEIVEKEIEKHSADGLGRVDYAIASGGAIVLKHSEPLIRANRLSRLIAGNVHGDAVKMLKPSFGQPGECFPLKADKGFVEIKLRTAIIPESITLEHVSKSVAFDRSSAPKECKVFGWLGHKKGKQEKKHLLTELTCDLEKSNAQTLK